MDSIQLPSVRTTLVDPAKKITYHVMAYRSLTRDELLMAVRMYLAQAGRKKPKAGSTVTIGTLIGT